MSETGKRLEQLGIQLPVRNRKGQGVVDAVIEDGMMYLSAHLPWIWRGSPCTPERWARTWIWRLHTRRRACAA